MPRDLFADRSPQEPQRRVPRDLLAPTDGRRSAAEVQQEYQDQPWYRQAATAVDDMARLTLNGLTFGAADKYFELMGQGGADRTQEARDRAGFAGGMAEAAGNIGTGMGASTAVARGVPQVAGNALSQTLARETAAGALVGGASEAAKGEDALQGTLFGGAGGAAGGVAGHAIGAGLNRIGSRLGIGAGTIADDVVPPRSTAELEAAKNRAYKAVEQSGVTYDRADTGSLAHDMRRGIDTRNPSGANVPANVGGLPGARSAMDDLDILLGRVPAPGSTMMTPHVSPLDLDQMRQTVRQRTSGNEAERSMGNEMIRDIDNFVASTTPRGQGMNAGEVEGMLTGARRSNQRLQSSRALDEAANRGANSVSGEGDVNYFRNILNDPKKRRLYPREEIEAMRRVVRGQTVENYLGAVGGNLGAFGLGGVGATAGFGLGGGPIGGLVGGIAGVGARSLANKASRSYTDASIDQLRRIVGGGSLAPAAIRGPLADTGQAMGARGNLGQLEDDREWSRRRRKRQ